MSWEIPPPDPEASWDMCFVCGPRNDHGLRQAFTRRGDRIETQFTGGEEHQGWPGVVHGGIIGSLLDETLGRAAALSGTWTMTARLEVRYRRPLPVGERATVSAELVHKGGRAIRAKGLITLGDGTVVAEAEALMVRVPDEIASRAQVAFDSGPGEPLPQI